MGRLSKIYVKEKSLETVKGIISESYNIVREESLKFEQDWRYNKYGNEAIILTKNYNSEWVELQLNFENSMYEHDEMLKDMSERLECVILICYYNSTFGKGRFAKFSSGSYDLSIVQEVAGRGINEQMTLVEKRGVSDDLAELFKIPNTGGKFFGINYDTAYRFFSYFGLVWDGKKRDNLDYIHLEISPNANK